MGVRHIANVLAPVVVTAWALLNAAPGLPSASADPCPDIEVMFARGTGEPPGIGFVGQAFVDALRPMIGDRSIGLYAVNYSASSDFRRSAPAGASDASAHVQSMAANCPGTRMVLGGMSQGAGVIDLIAANAPVSGYTPVSMPPEVADHVAAVVLFGNPSRTLPGGGPLTAISPLYGPKTIDLCAPGDPFCGQGLDIFAHLSYVSNGMVGQAAAFAASRL